MLESNTIVFIHGMMGDGEYWKPWKLFFEAKGYRCHTPNLPFHDTTFDERPDSRLSQLGIAEYVDDIRAFLLTLDEKPILIGHSMGALITQLLMAEGLAHKAVLIAPAPPAGILAFSPSILRSFLPIALECCFWKKAIRLSLKSARYALANLLSDEEARGLYHRGRWESGKAIAQMGLWFLDSEKTTRVDETKVTIPILVVAGGQDHSIPSSLARKVANKYPTARYLEYPDHAHWIIGEEGWQEVASMIACWIGDASQRYHSSIKE